jgi:hypothetical protein
MISKSRFFPLFLACNLLVNIVAFGISAILFGYTKNPIYIIPAIIILFSILFIRSVYHFIKTEEKKIMIKKEAG